MLFILLYYHSIPDQRKSLQHHGIPATIYHKRLFVPSINKFKCNHGTCSFARSHTVNNNLIGQGERERHTAEFFDIFRTIIRHINGPQYMSLLIS